MLTERVLGDKIRSCPCFFFALAVAMRAIKVTDRWVHLGTFVKQEFCQLVYDPSPTVPHFLRPIRPGHVMEAFLNNFYFFLE